MAFSMLHEQVFKFCKLICMTCTNTCNSNMITQTEFTYLSHKPHNTYSPNRLQIFFARTVCMTIYIMKHMITSKYYSVTISIFKYTCCTIASSVKFLFIKTCGCNLLPLNSEQQKQMKTTVECSRFPYMYTMYTDILNIRIYIFI